MKIILHLSIFSVSLGFVSNDAYSMDEIRRRLDRGRPSATVEIIQTNNATVIEEVVEERVSGVTDTDTDRDSLAERRPSFLDSINARPQLKRVVVVKDETPVINVAQGLSSLRIVPEKDDSQKHTSISLDVLSGLRGNLRPPSGKPPVSSVASSESVDKPNPYSQINLKKTSGSAGLTSSDSMENMTQAGEYKSASAPPKKEKAIEGRVPEANFSFVGGTRRVENKK